MKPAPIEKGKGRFHLGDIVDWQASSNVALRRGEIVEVVKYGGYPRLSRREAEINKTRKLERADIDWPELIHHGFMREHESYVVEDYQGKRYWPRVGNLRLVSEMNEDG